VRMAEVWSADGGVVLNVPEEIRTGRCPSAHANLSRCTFRPHPIFTPSVPISIARKSKNVNEM
jgi:hypothetical protein